MLVLAGPCGLMPDYDRMLKLACDLQDAGADVFRAALWKGGVFAPKDPEVWGMCAKGYEPLKQIGREAEMGVATEVRNLEQLEQSDFCEYVWTAARIQTSMDAMRLLAHGAKDAHHNLMIKRGPGATMRDLFGTISHIEDVGYPLEKLWVIERGVSGLTYSDEVRFRPDLLAIPQIKEAHPQIRVCFDASHSVGRREYVVPMALGAVAVGADGVMVEVLDKPDESPSDARQTISVDTFKHLMDKVRQLYGRNQ